MSAGAGAGDPQVLAVVGAEREIDMPPVFSGRRVHEIAAERRDMLMHADLVGGACPLVAVIPGACQRHGGVQVDDQPFHPVHAHAGFSGAGGTSVPESVSAFDSCATRARTVFSCEFTRTCTCPIFFVLRL